MTGKASATKMDAPKFCFGEGTQVHTARGLEEIQDLEPGRRVLADSGADMAASQVRGEGWLRVEFGFADPFGSGKDCRVVLLRPAAEVARNGWAAGLEHMSKQLRDDLDIVGTNGKVVLTMPKDSKVSKTIQREPHIEVRQDLPAKRKRK